MHLYRTLPPEGRLALALTYRATEQILAEKMRSERRHVKETDPEGNKPGTVDVATSPAFGSGEDLEDRGADESWDDEDEDFEDRFDGRWDQAQAGIWLESLVACNGGLFLTPVERRFNADGENLIRLQVAISDQGPWLSLNAVSGPRKLLAIAARPFDHPPVRSSYHWQGAFACSHESGLPTSVVEVLAQDRWAAERSVEVSRALELWDSHLRVEQEAAKRNRFVCKFVTMRTGEATDRIILGLDPTTELGIQQKLSLIHI